MRKYLLTSVAAMAIATPAMAADLSGGGYVSPVDPAGPMVVGDLEMSIGMGRLDVDGLGEADWNHFQGWARANVPVGTWNVLVEGGSSAVFGGDIPDGLSFSSTSANVHVWAGSNGVRYGAFGGASFGVAALATVGTVGLEAEADLGSNVTVGAQGFYSWADPLAAVCPVCEIDIYGAQAWLDYYITANTKVTGTASWMNVDTILGDADVWGVDGRVTHRFDGTPVNIFGQVGYRNVDIGGDVDVVSGKAGFTVMLDGPGYNQQEFDQAVPFSFKHPIAHAGSL